MERLKNVIEQYGRWSELTIYIERIDAHASTDFSHALENAKALLETIGKEICQSKGVELEAGTSINNVLRKAFLAIGYTGGNLVTKISSALATIGQNIGELRNEIGTTAHGKSLEELKARNSTVDDLTKELLLDTTAIVASFLIRAFEAEHPRITPEAAKPDVLYADDEPFNEFWDTLYGECEMGDYSFPASEVLFNVDYTAYLTERQIFTATMEEPEYEER
jgi:hypothetical protein